MLGQMMAKPVKKVGFGLRGERVAQHRKWLGLSQTDFAERLGTSQKQVSRWELNEVDPSSEYLLKMATVLEVDVNWLLGVTDDPQPRNLDQLNPYQSELLRAIDAGNIQKALKIITMMLDRQ